jgi:hypothetical protein
MESGKNTWWKLATGTYAMIASRSSSIKVYPDEILSVEEFARLVSLLTCSDAIDLVVVLVLQR